MCGARPLPLAHARAQLWFAPGHEDITVCIEGGFGVASAAPHNEKRRHRQVNAASQERHDTPNVALTTSYITHHPEGESRVSGGCHFLTDIAGYDPPRPRETRPVVETPEGETSSESCGW